MSDRSEQALRFSSGLLGLLLRPRFFPGHDALLAAVRAILAGANAPPAAAPAARAQPGGGRGPVEALGTGLGRGGSEGRLLAGLGLKGGELPPAAGLHGISKLLGTQERLSRLSRQRGELIAQVPPPPPPPAKRQRRAAPAPGEQRQMQQNTGREPPQQQSQQPHQQPQQPQQQPPRQPQRQQQEAGARQPAAASGPLPLCLLCLLSHDQVLHLPVGLLPLDEFQRLLPEQQRQQVPPQLRQLLTLVLQKLQQYQLAAQAAQAVQAGQAQQQPPAAAAAKQSSAPAAAPARAPAPGPVPAQRVLAAAATSPPSVPPPAPASRPASPSPPASPGASRAAMALIVALAGQSAHAGGTARPEGEEAQAGRPG